MKKKLGNKIFKTIFNNVRFLNQRKAEKEENWKVSKFLKIDNETTKFVVSFLKEAGKKCFGVCVEIKLIFVQ